MSRTFSPWEVEKQWLIHPSIHDQVPPGYLADFMCDLVREALDLDEIAQAYDDDVKRPPYYPALVTALLLYAWCEGLYSSRKIAKACEQRVDFMALTAMEHVDFATLREFRDRHAEELVAVLIRFFRVSQRLGLGVGPTVAQDDGEKTKMSFGRAADPFEEEARRWLDKSRILDEEEDRRHGRELRGDEVPKWLPDKPKRIRKLRDARLALEEEDRKRAAAARALAEDDDEDDAPSAKTIMPEEDDEPPRRPAEEHPLLARRAMRSRRATGLDLPPPVPEPVVAAPPPPARDLVPPGTRRPLTRSAELRPVPAAPAPPAPAPPAIEPEAPGARRPSGLHQRPEPAGAALPRDAARRDVHAERAHQRPEAPPSRSAARPTEPAPLPDPVPPARVAARPPEPAPPARVAARPPEPAPPSRVAARPPEPAPPSRVAARPPEPAPPSRVAARPPEPAPPRPPDAAPASRLASRPPSDAPVADSFMVNRPEGERLRLVEVVVAAALSDGQITAIEERRIDQLVRILRLDPRSRQRVFATIRAGVVPPMPTVDEFPDYEVRLHVFEQAAVMALADGMVHADEQRHLKALAARLELDIEDAKHALRRANFATGG